MSNRVLASIVFVELAAGLYLRWTLPGLWGPGALTAAFFMAAGTFYVWGRLETYLDRRRCLARMRFMRSARDPWRAYESSEAERAVRTAKVAMGRNMCGEGARPR
jgi:hypothetical protein